VEFPPTGGKDHVRSDQIRLIRSASILEEARVIASNCSDKEQDEEETVGKNLILQRAKDAHNVLYERFHQKASEQDIEEYCKLECELIGQIEKRKAHSKEIRSINKEISARNSSNIN
jgi:hypothetical protein